MTEEVQVEFVGIDKVSKAADEINARTSKMEKQLEATGEVSTTAAKTSAASWTEFRSAYTLVTEAVRIGQQVWENTVGVTVELANSVRQFRDVTGQTAEESSRLIQVLDDYKVSVGDAEKATKKLAKEGLEFNIETLAKLSDQYLALGSDVERTQFLYDKFGKSGENFAEIMRQGGDAILEANDAIDENLILTNEQLRQSREYEKHIDDLNDKLLAQKVIIGNELIPVFNSILTYQERSAEAQRRLGSALDDMTPAMQDLAIAQEIEKIRLQEVDAARWNGLASLYETTTATEDATEATEDLNQKNREFLSVLGSVQSAEESYQSKTNSLTEERIKLEDEKNKLLAQGWWEQSEKIQDINAKLDENSQKAQENADEHELANRRIILGLLERKLTQDGILDDRELAWLLEKGEAWGIYSETVVSETRKAIAEANLLADALNGLPTSKTFTYQLMTGGDVGLITQTPVGSQRRRAEGGNVIGGESYLVGERGMELFTPNQSGYITPNNKLGNANSDPKMYALLESIAANSRIDEAKLARSIVTAMARA